MFGEPTEITLAADPSGAMANLLGQLDEVGQAGLTDWALIGGLAVMVRLEDAHRPTRDIDTLSRQVDPEPKVTLLAIAQRETATGVLLPDGTRVDVIGVEPILDLDALPDNDRQRMFVLSPWWRPSSNPSRPATVQRRQNERAMPTTSTVSCGPAASPRSRKSWPERQPTSAPGACHTWKGCCRSL